MKKEKLRKLYKILDTYFFKSSEIREWEKLHNAFKGERVFLIGNGPSLNKTPLYLLDNEYTIAFNRFYLLNERINWFPSFYMCTDPVVVPDIHEEIFEYIKNINLSFFQKKHQKYFSNSSSSIMYIEEYPQFKFDYKLPMVSRGDQTVAIFALQVLLYLGFSEIYLIGVDQNYKDHETVKEINGREIESSYDDDPNHFDSRYFGKGRKYHLPNQWMRDKMMEGFRKAKIVFDRKGVKVFNAGIGGNLEVFPRMIFEDLFNTNSSVRFEKFVNSIDENLNPELVKEFLGDDMNLKDDASIVQLKNIEIFVLTMDKSFNKLSQLALTHIVYGPFKDRYILILRENLATLRNSYFEKN